MLTIWVLVTIHYLHIWKSYLGKGEETFKTARPFGEFPEYHPGSSITNIHKQVAARVPWTAHNFWKVWHLTCKVLLRFKDVNLRLQSSKSMFSSWGVNIDKVPVKFFRLLKIPPLKMLRITTVTVRLKSSVSFLSLTNLLKLSIFWAAEH